MTAPPPEEVRRLVEHVLEPVDEWSRAAGVGYTGATKWLVRSRGRRAFVKAAADSGELAGLRNECAVLLSLGSPHLPRVYGAHVDGPEVGVLVLEDLSAATWPPPWSDDLDGLAAEIRTLHALPVPDGLKSYATPTLRRWPAIERAPGDVLALGLFDESWLARHGDVLAAAEAEARLEGTELVHCDLGAPNLCFVAGRGVVVVDWAEAGAGNGTWDLVVLGTEVRYTTGGARRLVVPDAGPMLAFQAGSWAREAASPPPDWAVDGAGLRDIQRALARTALAWACEELGLPPPHGG